ncbi:Putative RxLR effector [Phytophthora palmivora]|uniref:RxLR effector n=1 Tax=Phytophthora palmivora TaxID=4796 RepID=A0A2P4WZI9_9STRA|nr:Putative RxLR effector [Phytophthora palmivora]
MRRSLLVLVLLVVLVVDCYSLATNGDSRYLRGQMVPNDAISHRNFKGKIIPKSVSKEAEERGGPQILMLNPAITGASTTSSKLILQYLF